MQELHGPSASQGVTEEIPIMKATKIRASIVAAVATATVLTPSIAQAGNEGRVIREGNCSGAANWKLKANPENRGRVAVEYEVDTNRRGERWRVRLFHDGRRVMNRTFVTRGRSGSFTVRDLMFDRRGSDRFRARAMQVRGPQDCAGRVRF
jgi:hypothetical protein